MHLLGEVPSYPKILVFFLPPTIEVSLLLSLDAAGTMYERVYSNVFVY